MRCDCKKPLAYISVKLQALSYSSALVLKGVDWSTQKI